MGENVYGFGGLGGTEWQAQFSEGALENAEELCSCLCTFPGNDSAAGCLSAGRVRGLAMLGAAVAMAHNAPEWLLSYDVYDVGDGCWRVMLPNGLPQWICNEIVRLVRDA